MKKESITRTSNTKTIIQFTIVALLIACMVNCFAQKQIKIGKKVKMGGNCFITQASNQFNQLSRIN